MIKTTVAVQVLPTTTKDTGIIPIVDAAIEVVKQSGVQYEVGPMETTLEGDLQQLMEIVQKAIQACLDAGASSVFTNVKILHNPTGVLSIHEKVAKHR